MSRTYAIACKQCKKSLWIGQGWPSARQFLYGQPEHIEALGTFLFAHLGHDLVFEDDERLDGYEELSKDEEPSA